MTRLDDIGLDLQALSLPTPEQQAQAVIDRFLDWATDPRLAVLDTETTGLGPGEQVIEIGMVDANGRTLMNQRVRPTFPVPAEASAIHGITDEDLKGCPTFDQVWSRLWELLQTHRVVVYNGGFDFNRIADSLNATMPGWYQGDGGPSELLRAWNALIPSVQRDGCVMEAYAPVHGEWSAWHGSCRWARLSAACAERGVDTSDLKAHSALDDARATLRLIQATAELTPEGLPWIGREEEA
ncbi:MAG: 3'-5' exonuclease [Deinococcus sp.]|uniref:3'-5' exonuclease n=1 Tax=Deinococcus sp. TaxID=47478 RepID=UPI0026DCF74A|nr:3'-5' exonuclease [Deinococcus sp.]MDO4246801.1 3'-5' exonuclease [Deinococcus sp.]